MPPRRAAGRAGRDARARAPRQVRGRAAGGRAKSDNTLGEICGIAGRAAGTIHGRLRRLKREGLGRRHDKKSPGRRRSLTPKQGGAIKEDLGKPPSESGFERGSWNSKMLAKLIRDKFGIVCSRRTALRVAGRLGFSTRKPRPAPCNSATAEEQAQFVREREGAIARWKAEGRAIPSIHGTTLRDSPVSRRGLRPRGGRDTVCTNYSRKSINLIGAPGDGTPGLRFHENLKADSYIALLEFARRRHKKIGVIADNAGALAGRAMKEYLQGTNGAVQMIHLRPRTPQLNPIETEWRGVRAATADTFFGSLDKMRDVIIRMLHNREMPVVKTLEWLRPQ